MPVWDPLEPGEEEVVCVQQTVTPTILPTANLLQDLCKVLMLVQHPLTCHTSWALASLMPAAGWCSSAGCPRHRPGS